MKLKAKKGWMKERSSLLNAINIKMNPNPLKKNPISSWVFDSRIARFKLSFSAANFQNI